METEPVNQGTDVLEDESLVISNPSPETSAMFPDCPEKGEWTFAKPKFNSKTAKISHAQKPQSPKMKKKGTQVKSKLKLQKGIRLSKNCSKSYKTKGMKRVNQMVLWCVCTDDGNH